MSAVAARPSLVCRRAGRLRLVVAASLLATAPHLRADPSSFSACAGDDCGYPPATRSSPAPCAAAVSDPGNFHNAFARGCLARRDFARAPSSGEAPRVESTDPERITVHVWGTAESEPDGAPSPTLEDRFATVLVRGNPEVPGGKIRHGAFHALGMYWGSDPLSFLYLNLRYGRFE